MESCVQLEDPDSRDSGISLAQSTTSQQSCSQSTLTNAIGEVDLLDNDDEEDGKENHDQFDEDAIEELDFRTQFVDRSPIKKRLRSFGRHKQTDFSFLHHSEEGNALEETNEETIVKVQPKSELSKPLGLSISHDTYENWLCPLSASQGSCAFTSSPVVASSSSTSSSCTIFSFRTQFDANDPLSFSSSLSTSSENELPASVRPTIHRVHSTSVLECSRDRSWGSPDALEHFSLVTVERPQVPHRAFRSIDAETMANLLGSLSEEQFQRKFILIDCRYPYEYDAGHILHSLNLWETNSIEEIFYPEEEERFGEIIARIPIFYCEYSQKRGPKMALALRERDRSRNESRYPYVDYKEIYLLDRGYRYFFKERKFSKYCTPQAYVQMWDSAYSEQRKCYDSHRRVKKRRRNN